MTSYERKDNWYPEARNSQKELFSELNILLKALDRFFVSDNLPVSQDDLPNRNFYEEMVVVRDVILRIIGIIEFIIPESRKNAYWFQRFTESKLLNDHARDLMREKLYRQDSPEKSLYLLYDLFVNLRGVITDLLKPGEISYPVYQNIGHLLGKAIRENVFLNPFSVEKKHEFERIINHAITDIVKAIHNQETKRHVSLLFLHLFRFLRYLRYIDITSPRTISLHTTLVILILLRSEMTAFRSFLQTASCRVQGDTLKMLLNSLAYQFSMETKRVFVQELKEIMRKKGSSYFRGKLETSHGILKNLIEQSIVQIAREYRPDIAGDALFESFTERLSQSLKLREDIYVLSRLLAFIGEKAATREKNMDSMQPLRNFMEYFESLSFKLLRYEDYDEFFSFFQDLLSHDQKDIEKSLEKIHAFTIFLETTLQQINNRAELAGRPLDRKKADALLHQYL
ncbi:MAG: hypothetical protein RDU01_11255 [Thermodesulfovibrionales bacterium]|nr:hypothetical protein [Thermodesulfovibrionales bacterium]